MDLKLLQPEDWKDYELLDSGDLKKLERFGNRIVIRPDMQSVWPTRLTMGEWRKKAHFEFNYSGKKTGDWKPLNPLPKGKWQVKYPLGDKQIVLNLEPTAYKHVGLFPEQAPNWDYIYKAVKTCPVETPKVLNLFAYTGGASLAARAAGADITHVDSIRQVVNWASKNQESSQLQDIRWLVEDAFKFVEREVKRGKKYQGIILDPPSFGTAAKGKLWKLEEQINPLLEKIVELLDPKHHFLIFNTYSVGYSALVIDNIFGFYYQKKFKKNIPGKEIGELCLSSKTGQILPMSFYLRVNSFQK